MGLLSPFFCVFQLYFYTFHSEKYLFVYTNVCDFMNICTYVNVCKMWKTPEKCGKLGKNS